MARQTLIAAHRVRSTQAVIVAALVVLLALGGWLHGRRRTAFDDWCARQLYDTVSHSASQILIGFSAPPIPLALLVIVVACAAYARRADLIGLAVLAPAVALALCEYVGKPVVGRLLGGSGSGSFPSGHETGVCSAALVVGVALAQLTLARRAWALWSGVLGLWAIVAGVGLVRAGWHYVTDVVGAVALCVVVVFGVALALDRVFAIRCGRRDELSSPDGRDPTRTARAV